jgi:hypothetical protein
MNSKKFRLEITEEGLNTITQALECYSRLGCNQFQYALDYNTKFFNLNHDDRKEIIDYLRFKIDAREWGIFERHVEPFTKAFEIKKEIEKRIYLSNNDGVRKNLTNESAGPIYKHNYLPKFLNEKNEEIKDCKEFPISVKIRTKLKKLNKSKKYNELWAEINKNINFKNIKGNKSEISKDFTKVIVWEPYLLKRYEVSHAG